MSKIRFPRKLKKELKKKGIYESACLKQMLIGKHIYLKPVNGIAAKLHEFVDAVEKIHDELNQVVEEHPEFLMFISDLHEGLMSPVEAAEKYFDFEFSTETNKKLNEI